MREYELTVVLHPDLEANLDPTLKKVRAIITDNGGKINKEDNWGKKRFAYRIAKEDFGLYVYFEVELPAEAVAKLNATLNITDEVMRFLLVSVDVKARKAAEEAATAARQTSDKEEE